MHIKKTAILLLLLGFVLACTFPALETTVGPQNTETPIIDLTFPEIITTNTTHPPLVATLPNVQNQTPTPNPERELPPIRTEQVIYTIQQYDTLAAIAAEYGIGVNFLADSNMIEDPNLIFPGQEIVIPPPVLTNQGPDNKLLPDSELVNGPSGIVFNIDEFLSQQNGYIVEYLEDVNGDLISGSEIIRRAAFDFSVNPRVLITILELRTGWITNSNPQFQDHINPLSLENNGRTGLYRQLIWLANEINRGYYLWQVNGYATLLLLDESVVPISPILNSGTASLQYALGLLYDYPTWLAMVSEAGFFHTYKTLFEHPFAIEIDPLVPEDVTQPFLQLPFETGKIWSFTGAPHGSWGDGSAWGGLDFAPPGEALGCVSSNEWVVAVADGWIVRSERGEVIQDLDMDGYEQTGWNILYLHIETRDRIDAGTYVEAGDYIGHPSCEGGVSTGTHVHIARKYNGQWMDAVNEIPFNLEGWTPITYGIAYNGALVKGSELIEARTGRYPENEIQR